MKKLLGLIILSLFVLSACGMSQEQWRAVSKASCNLSVNCDPTTGRVDLGPKPVAPRAIATKSGTLLRDGNSLRNGLKSKYKYKSDQYCVYQDGTTLNVGYRPCPPSI